MGSTRALRGPGAPFRRAALAAALCLALSFPLAAQNSTLTAVEIQNIDKKLKDPALPAAERRETLRSLARLLSLSGNIEGAAQIWMEAAYAGQVPDEGALLEGALCFVALGELDRAEAALKPILAAPGSRAAPRARYTAARIEAFRTGNPQGLMVFINDPQYAGLKPLTFYTIWRISNSEAYKTRLLSEFPASPEARSLNEAGPVSVVPRPLWFLFPGRDSVALASPAPVSPGGASPAPPPQGAPPVPPPSSGSTAGDAPRILQTGLFSREENARAMADQLRAAGFSPQVDRRLINGTGYWTVGVGPGADPGHTILALKDAGFESFPVYER